MKKDIKETITAEIITMIESAQASGATGNGVWVIFPRPEILVATSKPPEGGFLVTIT